MNLDVFKWRYKSSVIFIVIISICIAFLIWTKSLEYYDNISKNRFEDIVKQNMYNFQKRMSYYEHALIGAAGLVNTNHKITKTDWHNYITALNISENYPGIQGIGYSPILFSRDTINIKPEGIRKKYVPVIYIEPMNERNMNALGYDLYSESKRRTILDLARDTGLTSTTDKVTLIQEIYLDKQAGILMYIPVYKGNKQESIEVRRKTIIGYVSGVFRMNDLMKNISLKQSILNFEIYDNKNQTIDSLLFKSFIEDRSKSLYKISKEIKINNKIWYLNFYSTESFENKFNYDYPIISTLLGIFVYFLLLLIIIYVINTKRTNQLITNELIETNKNLKFNQEKYKAVVEQSLTGIYIFQEEKFLFANNQFCEMFGYTEEEVLSSLKPIDVVAQNDYNKAKREIDDRYSGKKNSSHYIVRGIKKDKTLMWIEIYGNTMEINGIPSITGTVIDITERVEAQQQVDNLFNFSNIGLAITSLDRGWIQINKKILDILDYSKEELFALSWDKITYENDLHKDESLFKEIINGERDSYHIEKRFIKKSGEIVYTILTISVFRENGKIAYFLASILDITDIKTKEGLLFQQSKMAAMGEMIGNISHQWKQPLSLISISNSLIRINQEIPDFNTKEEIYEAIDRIGDSVKYLTQTIDDFRNFFKPNKEKLTFDIKKCIDKTLKLVSFGFKNKEINVIHNIQSSIIKTFENDLIQVLINILNNAKDALLDIQDLKIIMIFVKEEDGNLIISINDNAGGIPKDIINEIFKPYFTTKEDDKGTGIGLYMVSEIINKHLKGKIEVYNKHFIYEDTEYYGAEFRITIPL